MNQTLKLAALGATLAVFTAGCATYTGQTNDPAPGFENVRAGTEEDFILNVGRRVYFTQDSAALDSVAKATLDKQAVWLNQNPSWLIKLQGFSDDSGSAGQMAKLSQKRAESVKAYFEAKGVPADRVTAKGYGETAPSAPIDGLKGGKLKAAQAKNRRVEFKLLSDLQQ